MRAVLAAAPVVSLALLSFLQGACGESDSNPQGLKPLSGITPKTDAADAPLQEASIDALSESRDSTAEFSTVSESGADVALEAEAGPAACTPDPSSTPPSAGSCVVAGDPGYECNPITGAPCDPGAQICDFSDLVFRCVSASPSPAAPCESCNVSQDLRCHPGFACDGLAGRCSRFCCTKEDCALGTECVPQPPTSLGICQAVAGTNFAEFAFGPGAQGKPDGGSGPVTSQPECKVLAGPASGSCVPTGEAFVCNPFTSDGCDDAAGESCQWSTGAFGCVTGEHSAGPCQACDASHRCQTGFVCTEKGLCAKLCCQPDDCASARCDAIGFDNTTLGVCVSPDEEVGDV